MWGCFVYKRFFLYTVTEIEYVCSEPESAIEISYMCNKYTLKS